MATTDRSTSRRFPPIERHPWEVPAARQPFVISTVLQAVSSPQMFVAMMLILWSVSTNVVTPMVGAWTGLALCAWVERRFHSDAWSFIPRRHQDPHRHPAAAVFLPTLLQTIALAGASLWYLHRLGTEATATEAAPLALGAIIALSLGDLLVLVWLRRTSQPRQRRVPATLLDSLRITVVTMLSLTALVVFRTSQGPYSGMLTGMAAVATFYGLKAFVSQVPKHVRCAPLRLL